MKLFLSMMILFLTINLSLQKQTKVLYKHKPIRKTGRASYKGQVLVEGYATQEGELALGQKL